MIAIFERNRPGAILYSTGALYGVQLVFIFTGAFVVRNIVGHHSNYFSRLPAFFAARLQELDFFTLIQGFVPVSHNRAIMHKYIFTVCVQDKTVPLCIVKPLHRTDRLCQLTNLFLFNCRPGYTPFGKPGMCVFMVLLYQVFLRREFTTVATDSYKDLRLRRVENVTRDLTERKNVLPGPGTKLPSTCPIRYRVLHLYLIYKVRLQDFAESGIANVHS